jgi:hypothetical protein
MLAWILVGFPVIGGLVGALSVPRSKGKPLERLEAERAAE